MSHVKGVPQLLLEQTTDIFHDPGDAGIDIALGIPENSPDELLVSPGASHELLLINFLL